MNNQKWDKPFGCCSQCGATLNKYGMGGYILHDGTYAVKATEIDQIEFALTRDKAATPSLPIPDGTQEQPR